MRSQHGDHTPARTPDQCFGRRRGRRGSGPGSRRRGTRAGADCTRGCWQRVWWGRGTRCRWRTTMERVLEPELMEDPEQARAYARADFEEENQGFVDRFVEFYPEFKAGHVLDLGCGPADIPIRLARKLSECRITGVDGSPPMIAIGLDVICV